MRSPALLLIPFIVLPILEITLLIRVGSVIGVLPTIALVIGTAAAGAWLLRREGLGVLARVRAALDAGQMPARELLDGAAILIGGVLLLTPGFITDALGLFCLLPATRRLLIDLLARQVTVVAAGGFRGQAGRQARGSRTIDGEFRRED